MTELEQYDRLNAERRLRRFEPMTLRAAFWALRSVRSVRRDLRRHGLAATVKPPPSALTWGSRTGVNGVLSRLEPTCLERAMVLQTWLAAHNVRTDIVVGVARDEHGKVSAHAWIDGITHPDEHAKYSVIHRIPPRT